MALPMTYSRRKRIRERQEQPIPFRDITFGHKLLTQIFLIIQKMDDIFSYDKKITPILVQHVREEMGLISLVNSSNVNQEFYTWFLAEMSDGSNLKLDLRLDVIEIACSVAATKSSAMDRLGYYTKSNRSVVDGLVDELNERMLEDGFGYQFKDGQIIEITSEFTFKQVVIPALNLISNPLFKNVDHEFREAFEEFKLGKFDDCVVDCGNALESVIKIIAAKKGWSDVKDSDPAARLIDALFRHDFVPTYMQDQINGLRMMIQGTATVRNKEGGHGAGETTRDIDRHLAAYQLHQTAAVIVFLVEQSGLS